MMNGRTSPGESAGSPTENGKGVALFPLFYDPRKMRSRAVSEPLFGGPASRG
ncbi:MAG: hypothetical protein ABIJ25_04930 [Pseudomonadota bacterium]